jgi:hypothetical protein
LEIVDGDDAPVEAAGRLRMLPARLVNAGQPDTVAPVRLAVCIGWLLVLRQLVSARARRAWWHCPLGTFMTATVAEGWRRGGVGDGDPTTGVRPVEGSSIGRAMAAVTRRRQVSTRI